MVAKAYIPDGYTEKAFVKAVPGMHEGVHFEYRPMMPDKIRAVINSWELISAEEKTRRVNAVIIKQLGSWDYSHKGEVLPIDQGTLLHTKLPLIDRIFNMIAQFEVSDIEVAEETGELDLDKLLGPQEEEAAKN